MDNNNITKDSNDETVKVEMKVQNFDEVNKNGRSYDKESIDQLEENSNNITEDNNGDDENQLLFEEGNEGILDNYSSEQIRSMIKEAGNIVSIMESNWRTSEKEFKLKDEHMKKLHVFNMNHRKEKPDNVSEEEWDFFNGLDSLTDDDIIDIFGEEHPIIGIHHDQTIDRIKDVTGDFFNWMNALKEYNMIQAAYMELIDSNEEKEIEKLKVLAENESDPEKKSKMQSSIDSYYSNKYLDFLRDELSEKDKNMLVNVYGDNKKCEYWINRTRDKMNQLRINNKFILEISQFEKRFLPEKYHVCSNMLLLYFMKMIIYANTGDPKDIDRTRSIAMVLCLDNVVRNIYKDEKKERILNNIMAYLDQIYDQIIEKYGNKLSEENK